MSIYKKLFEIQKATRGFGKDKSGVNYQYVSGTKILNHIREQMDLKGVILKQEVLSIENDRNNYIVGITKDNPQGRNKSEILSKVMMRFTWVDVDTGEKDENLFGANGQNDWDKGVGSALTYAERYFILKFFHIPNDEDDIDNPTLQKVIDLIQEANSTEELTSIYNSNQQYHTDKDFMSELSKRKKEVLKPTS